MLLVEVAQSACVAATVTALPSETRGTSPDVTRQFPAGARPWLGGRSRERTARTRQTWRRERRRELARVAGTAIDVKRLRVYPEVQTLSGDCPHFPTSALYQTRRFLHVVVRDTRWCRHYRPSAPA